MYATPASHPCDRWSRPTGDGGAFRPVTGNTALWTHASYLAMAVGFFVPPLAFVGALVAHGQKPGGAGTVLQSHHRWILRTFWIWLAVSIVGWVLSLVLIGYAVLFVLGLWYAWRVAKGWLLLGSGRPIEDPYSLL